MFEAAGEVEAEESRLAPGDSSSALSVSGEPGTLMEITFQKNLRQKYKFLEAEPKILGAAEIALSVYLLLFRIPFCLTLIEADLMGYLTIPFTGVGIIAGSVTIAAQNLHLRRLKACLGMQVITALACIYCALYTVATEYHNHIICWGHYDFDFPHKESSNTTCATIERFLGKLVLADELVLTVQIIFAVTLAAYCCKVIPCCSPRSTVPVIAMRPTATQQ